LQKITGLNQQDLNVQLVSLATMEHKIITLSRKQTNEISNEVELKKAVSLTETGDGVPIQNDDVHLKKSLSTSK